MTAIREAVEEALRREGQRVWHVEGSASSGGRSADRSGGQRSASSDVSEPLAWLLIDCGDVVVHVFNPSAREFYQLERLWADAPHLSPDSHA